MQSIALEIFLGGIAFLAATFLGILVLIRNRSSWTNRLFFILCLLIDAYIVVNFLSLHPPSFSPEAQLFWIRVVMFVTSFIGPTLILLTHTFPSDRIRMGRTYLIALGILMLASATASLSPLVFRDIHYPNGNPVPIPGPGIFIFFLDFIGLFLLSFVILIIKYWRAPQDEKSRHLHLLLGTLASFSLMGLTTVVFVVILRSSSFVFLGPIFPIILIVFVAYAIIRHGLFHVQVFTTELLVASLWLVLFSKIFFSGNTVEIVSDAVIFLMSVMLGILLIKSVTREIIQKEHLQHVSDELAAANEDLKRLDTAKSDFISIASHQLRAPLTVIKGYLSLVLEGALGRIPVKAKEALSRTFLQAEQLVRLVNNLLDLSRIESGKIQYSYSMADLEELINEVIAEFKQKAEEKNMTIVFRAQKKVEPFYFDRDKVREIVINLIDNAIKYSPGGTIVVLEDLVEKRGSLFVRIGIKDNGIGIRREELPRLFEKFSRAEEARTIDPNGMGLGLYFVRRIALDHGGNAWVESKGIGKGSTFFFELPVKGE